MASEHMLTTFDNPYDPFEDFTLWHLFDIEMGYQTCERLAKVAHLTDDMTQQEEDEEIERAMDQIIEHDFLNIYKKVGKETARTN